MPKPGDYKNQDDWMGACMSTRKDEHPDESQEQSVAICMGMWRDKGAGGVIHRTNGEASRGDMEFILSDATPDRYGDIIVAEGFDLTNFKKNPVALFNHSAGFPIGTWEDLRVVKGALRGHLRLAPEGISSRIDEIRKLVQAGILKAVSVGFTDIESEPLGMTKTPMGMMPSGNRYTKSELVECSVVSVGANPNALAIAKSLRISDDTLAEVFAGYGDQKDDQIKRRGSEWRVRRKVTSEKRGAVDDDFHYREAHRGYAGAYRQAAHTAR